MSFAVHDGRSGFMLGKQAFRTPISAALHAT